MPKYYRVKKDTFLWKEGAILEFKPGTNTEFFKGYYPIEDVWDNTPVNGKEYISDRIIEHPDNAEWFERVYPDSAKGRLFKTKDQVVAAYKKSFKE